MKFKNLDELIKSRSAVAAGFDYFISNPLEFIRLVELDHALALSYAIGFSSDGIRAMLDNAYGVFVNDKFFTKLLNIDPNKVAFNSMVNNSDMLQYFKTKPLTSLNTQDSSKYQAVYSNGYHYTYAFFYNDPEKNTPIAWGIQKDNFMDHSHMYDQRGLEIKYREASQNKDIKWRILTIATTLIKKIASNSTLLDAEFKEEESLLSGKSTTNRLFPVLFNWPVAAMHEIVTLLLERCSKDTVCKQMVATNVHTGQSYLRFIIDNYPTIKDVYDVVYTNISQLALEGRSKFRDYLDEIVFDVVDLLFDKDPDCAESFYRLGELCLKPNSRDVNPIDKRWTVGTGKITTLRNGKMVKNTDRLTNAHLQAFFPPPPPYFQQGYNPELFTNNKNNNNTSGFSTKGGLGS